MSKQTIILSDFQPTQELLDGLLEKGHMPNTSKYTVFDKHSITSKLGLTPFGVDTEEYTFFYRQYKKELSRLLNKKSFSLFYILYDASHKEVSDTILDMVHVDSVRIVHVFSLYSNRIFLQHATGDRSHIIF